jgi:integrase
LSDATCPVVAVETWIKFARIAKDPLFRRVRGQDKDVGPDRLNDREVTRLVKKTALAAGIRGNLSEGERAEKLSGHSLRAGLASSAKVDERYMSASRRWKSKVSRIFGLAAPNRRIVDPPRLIRLPALVAGTGVS